MSRVPFSDDITVYPVSQVSFTSGADVKAMSNKGKTKKTMTPSTVRKTISTELHRPMRRNLTRRVVDLKGLHDLFQADLVGMIPHLRKNKGYKYRMTVINALSKFFYAVPLKTKNGADIARALYPLLAVNSMKFLLMDKGKEF